MELPAGFGLAEKTVLVTGAARGLGRGIAVAFAQCGAALVVCDIADPAATVEIIERIGSPCLGARADVTDEAQIRNLAETAIARFGRIDILVNNAGISQLSYTPSEDLEVEQWDRIMAVNLRGTFLCCKIIGKTMIAAGTGSIVNIASTAGITGIARAPAYCASKAGVVLLTKSLALEWARHNIRVNAVAPHYLQTDLTASLRRSDKIMAGITRQIPLRRIARPEEVVAQVLLLASEAASYTTGTVVPVDGGYLAS